jgi:hypothetical protein
VLPQHQDQKQLNPRNSLCINHNSHNSHNTYHQLHLTIVLDVEAVTTPLLVAVGRVVMTVGTRFNKVVQVWVKA